MRQCGASEPEWIRLERPQAGLWRFGGYLGSGASFRRNSQAINGLLTGILCVVSRALGAVFGEEVVYHG